MSKREKESRREGEKEEGKARHRKRGKEKEKSKRDSLLKNEEKKNKTNKPIEIESSSAVL